MVLLTVIVVLLTGVSTLAQENVSLIDNITQPIETTTQYVLPIDLSSILRIYFYLKEEGVNQVAAQLIYNASVVNITVSDLVEVTQAENYNLTAINQVLDQLDLSSSDLFNFDSLEPTFTELNVSALGIYRKLLEEFIPEPRTNVPGLLDIFSIDQVAFNDVILYGNDTELFKILKSANFSEENTKEAFSLIQKTPSDLYEFVKPIIFASIKVYPVERLLDIVKENGLTPKHFKDVLDAFEVRGERYETVPSFKSALTDFVDEINNVELYGTLVNSSVVATVNYVYNRYKYLRHVADLYVLNILTPRVSYKVNNIDAYSDSCLYGPVLLTFDGISQGNVVEITQNYAEHHPPRCYYAVVENYTLIVEKLDHVHYHQQNLIADVSNNTLFKIGSPLVCNDYLYGVAESDSRGRIGFRSFHCADASLDTTTIFSDETSSASTVNSKIWQAVVLAVTIKLLLQYE